MRLVAYCLLFTVSSALHCTGTYSPLCWLYKFTEMSVCITINQPAPCPEV